MDTLVTVTDILEKMILLVLLGLSIWSVSIMIDRKRVFKAENSFDIEKLKSSIRGKDLSQAQQLCQNQESHISGAMREALKSKSPDGIEKAVSSFAKADRIRLEKGLAILGTLGANAPFIGLFGTVLGIIRAFAYIGSQSGSAAVMSGVSQALYATAFGLFVAIPAVVAYNIFSKRLKDLTLNLESVRDLYIAGIEG